MDDWRCHYGVRASDRGLDRVSDRRQIGEGSRGIGRGWWPAPPAASHTPCGLACKVDGGCQSDVFPNNVSVAEKSSNLGLLRLQTKQQITRFHSKPLPVKTRGIFFHRHVSFTIGSLTLGATYLRAKSRGVSPSCGHARVRVRVREQAGYQRARL